jgi:GntR family transcriptional regulator
VPLEKSRPQYRQIADVLRDEIERGDIAPGSTLPAEPELAARFSATRPTVNRALAVLSTEGLIRTHRGRGTQVRRIPVIHRTAMARYDRKARERNGAHGAFDTEIRSLGMEPRTETEVALATPPDAVAEALGLAKDEQSAIMRKRRMQADNVPVQLATSWIPAEIATGTQLAEVDSGPGGIISRFRELGYEQVRLTESVRLRRSTDEEQEFLGLEDDQPVVEIWHTGWTKDDRAVEVCIHAVPAYLWVLHYDWPLT